MTSNVIEQKKEVSARSNEALPGVELSRSIDQHMKEMVGVMQDSLHAMSTRAATSPAAQG